MPRELHERVRRGHVVNLYFMTRGGLLCSFIQKLTLYAQGLLLTDSLKTSTFLQ